MTATKSEIVKLVELMSDDAASTVLSWLTHTFTSQHSLTASWDTIEEVEPDEIDIAMLQAIENNPDCKAFVHMSDTLVI